MLNAKHFALRSFTLVLLIAALPSLAFGGVVCVDAVSLNPAMVQPALAPPALHVGDAPGTPSAFDNPGSRVFVLSYRAASPDPEPLSSGSSLGVTSAFPGDIVFLTDPNGSTAPSNWLAVMRFLNPTDPTGSLGLAATDEEVFFADNVGPGGFADLSLFPNALTVDSSQAAPPNQYLGSVTEFGVDGAIRAGQTAYILYLISDTAVPEPGTVTLLALAISSGLLVALRRRTRRV